MAKNITGQVLGGTAKANLEGDSVQDIYNKLALNGTYTASINGEPADMSDELEDYNFVSFAPAVKGGLI